MWKTSNWSSWEKQARWRDRRGIRRSVEDQASRWLAMDALSLQAKRLKHAAGSTEHPAFAVFGFAESASGFSIDRGTVM
jgi:hypothetical protein